MLFGPRMIRFPRKDEMASPWLRKQPHFSGAASHSLGNDTANHVESRLFPHLRDKYLFRKTFISSFPQVTGKVFSPLLTKARF